LRVPCEAARGTLLHAAVWTNRQVKEWRETGIGSALAVWTPAQLARSSITLQCARARQTIRVGGDVRREGLAIRDELRGRRSGRRPGHRRRGTPGITRVCSQVVGQMR
jgi:hypothetical protein